MQGEMTVSGKIYISSPANGNDYSFSLPHYNGGEGQFSIPGFVSQVMASPNRRVLTDLLSEIKEAAFRVYSVNSCHQYRNLVVPVLF